ncbi:MAG: hypothetical protein ACYDCS_04120 [Candidatus Dormibacteria bacterium]
MSTPSRRRGPLQRSERRDMRDGIANLLRTIEQGDLGASRSMVDRLEGAMLALDALDAAGAPHPTKKSLSDAADFLQRLAELVERGELEATPGMAAALEGGADTLAAVATPAGAGEP